MSTLVKVGCVLFFFKMLFLKSLAASRQLLILKKHGFDGVFSILLLLTSRIGVFQRNKNHALQFDPSPYKKISVKKNEVSIFARGENF